MHNHAAFFVLTFLLVPMASGTTYVVNPEGTGDFPTIQAAIDAITDGDVIELANGIFVGEGNRDINYLGKAITIRSRSGNRDSCLIACSYYGRGFLFRTGEGPASILEGVTIQAGYSPEYGGGILVDGAAPTISNCVLVSCVAGVAGGGAWCKGSAEVTRIIDCVFKNNSSLNSAGGIYCREGVFLLDGCSFVFNEAYGHGSGTVLREATITYRCCTFSHNSGVSCICFGSDCEALFQNIVVAFDAQGPAFDTGSLPNYSTLTLTCCDLFGNAGGDWDCDWIENQYGIAGNISENPLFCDPENGLFTVAEDSPCAPFSPPNSECDLIGALPVGCGLMDVSEKKHPPIGIALGQNTPNPFPNATQLVYSVPGTAPATVHLAIYDTAGRLIRTLVDADRTPGSHTALWDGNDDVGSRVAAGAYFCRITVGQGTATRQMLFAR